MATEKISVTVDADTLAEVRSLLDGAVTLSAVIDDALHHARSRLRLLALLDEWDAEDPPTSADRKRAGAAWRRAVS